MKKTLGMLRTMVIFLWVPLLLPQALPLCSAQVKPYVPPAWSVTITPQQNGQDVSVAVTVDLPDPCHYVGTWGQPQLFGQSVYVDTEFWYNSGEDCAAVITPVSANYDLGTLSPGNYTFVFQAWSSTVTTRAFMVNSTLAASFTATPTNGGAPLTVTFADTSTGSITNWFWDFGDGGITNVATNGVVYTYTTAGVYTVMEIVSGLDGSSTDTVANLINVYDPFAWWQLGYFGCTNCTLAQPNADPYGTGMCNTNRFLAGFNPTNTAAYLHVISIVVQPVAGSNNVVVMYLGPNGDNTYAPGIASRTNVLDYMTGDANGNYTNGGWQDTGQTNILSGGNGSGAVTNMTDQAIPTIPANRYYRVRVLLP